MIYTQRQANLTNIIKLTMRDCLPYYTTWVQRNRVDVLKPGTNEPVF